MKSKAAVRNRPLWNGLSGAAGPTATRSDSLASRTAPHAYRDHLHAVLVAESSGIVRGDHLHAHALLFEDRDELPRPKESRARRRPKPADAPPMLILPHDRGDRHVVVEPLKCLARGDFGPGLEPFLVEQLPDRAEHTRSPTRPRVEIERNEADVSRSAGHATGLNRDLEGGFTPVGEVLSYAPNASAKAACIARQERRSAFSL